MCGIAGFCNYTVDLMNSRQYWQKSLVDMRLAIAHRGPDSSGEYLRQHIGLSHARLSIRDLMLGSQPMIRSRFNQEYAIVYNGEIYNTDELISPLKQAGYQFETTSDTEVILYAYMEYGADFVEKLNGIFAFAIWDEKANTLFLYRDRLGVKPLFYTVQNGFLVFGSEQKALFSHPEITPVIDKNSMCEVLALGPARKPGSGVFRNVHEIKPGHYAAFTSDGLKEIQYWDLSAKDHTDSYEQTVETVSFLVRDAIERQMISDVPVCSFLSGGIDSSIVTAVAYQFMKENGTNLNTFSFDFKGNDDFFQSNAFQPERDVTFVKEMLKHYPTNHHFLECDEEHLAALLPQAVDAKDLPGMADIDSSLLYFCSLVAKNNKVSLTGECADEIFCGYPWFYREDLLTANTFPWSLDFQARTSLLRPEVTKNLHLSDFIQEQYQNTLAAVPYASGEKEADIKCREITYLNIKWFMQTLLDRMDRTSMYSGLESRVPFADHRIVEYVFNVPWEMKYKNNVAKSLLRDACHDLLPDSILNRKKSPYPKTYNPNYERVLAHDFLAILENPHSPILEFIDKEKSIAFASAPAEYGKPWFGQLMAAPQMMAYMIQTNYWLEKHGGYQL
ncbi:asparagine synthase (glutamine-hydrolyzing) [Scatolibacter rhodanostii]|uniref:asparagine synthase (glutamine-hydrolyzing) n=1 Tax=Scatolibacter rhodanostii TaxID=2014781 RepID=UPI000C08C5E4|nr:asparagine synthase (glutamine-hydrolyzing) [Scatolibacter rhodanostii]